jgi:tRNA-dihydrouridine synthase
MHREIARIAEDAGIAALAVHGRTRDQQYAGTAEYDTIAAIKAMLRIPVVRQRRHRFAGEGEGQVLEATGCDAVMIGRAAQGRPWIFGQIAHYLATGEHLPEPSPVEVRDILLGHLGSCMRSTARYPGRAHRAQAPGLVCEGPAGERGVPRRREPARRPRTNSCG